MVRPSISPLGIPLFLALLLLAAIACHPSLGPIGAASPAVQSTAPSVAGAPSLTRPPSQPTSLSTSTPITPCPPLSPAELAPPRFPIRLTLAKESAPGTMQPIDPTRVFAPDATFHAIVSVEHAPPNSKLTATWYAADVGDEAECNALIESIDARIGGAGNLDLLVRPAERWSVGLYRVEISVDDVAVLETAFEVEPTLASPTP